MSAPGAWRETVRPSDRDAVKEIVASSGFFHAYEVDVAVELVDEALAKGDAAGYHFVFPAGEDHPGGYACFGPIACTQDSWDLYWIAVRAESRGRGLGKRLFSEVLRRVEAAGGRGLWIETSSRELYRPTRAFYLARGCLEIARMPGFYSAADDKIVYLKALAPASQS